MELMSEINNVGNVTPWGGANDPNGYTICGKYPEDDNILNQFYYSPAPARILSRGWRISNANYNYIL